MAVLGGSPVEGESEAPALPSFDDDAEAEAALARFKAK